jgi:nanoRNase/pAp phosphatase (c-di-AMP/oligoRNAs hydrolase)
LKSISTKEIKKTYSYIEEAENITILGHVNPDYDCLLSMLSCHVIFTEIFKKDVDIVFSGFVPLKGQDFARQVGLDLNPRNPLEYDFPNKDLLVVIDTSGTYRSNSKLESINLEQFNKIIIIDHHKAMDNSYEDEHINFQVRREYASSVEVVFEVFKESIEKLGANKELVCRMLAFALIDDSKLFYIHQSNLETVEHFLEIVKIGDIDVSGLMQYYKSVPFEYYTLYSDMLNSLKQHPAGFRYAFIEEPHEAEAMPLFEEVKDMFKSDMTRISDGDVYIFIQKNKRTEDEGIYKVRTRSRHMDLSQFYKMLHPNGGGHPNAAGAIVEAESDSEALGYVAQKFEEFKKNKAGR